MKWNQGTKLEKIDPNEDTSEFDIETNDMIIPMDSSRLEGHEDDGVTTILCLGNNPFADDRSGDGLASLIAGKTNSTVYDCSFPDSSAACRYAIYNPEYTKDHFNLYYVVESLRSGDLTAINSIAGDEPDPRYQEAVDVMKTVDMSKVDILIIMYDSTDYNNGTPSDNPDNSYDVTAFTGGLRTSLKNIQETWPYIRIFVMSPTYAQYMDEDRNLHNGTTTDLGNGTLNHYLLKEIDASMDCGVSLSITTLARSTRIITKNTCATICMSIRLDAKSLQTASPPLSMPQQALQMQQKKLPPVNNYSPERSSSKS